MKITQSEVKLILAFREMNEKREAEFVELEREVKEIGSKIKDISRYLCPQCIMVLQKISKFREVLGQSGPIENEKWHA